MQSRTSECAIAGIVARSLQIFSERVVLGRIVTIGLWPRFGGGGVDGVLKGQSTEVPLSRLYIFTGVISVSHVGAGLYILKT